MHYTEKIQTSIWQGMYSFLHFVIKSLHRGEGSFEQRRSDFNPIGTCNSCSIPAVPEKQNWQIVLSLKSTASEPHKFQTKDAETFSSLQLIDVSTKNQYAQYLQSPIHSLISITSFCTRFERTHAVSITRPCPITPPIASKFSTTSAACTLPIDRPK